MTTREAVEYFEQLVKYFTDNPDDAYWAKKHNRMGREAIEAALAAMREKAEREKGCDCCIGGEPITRRANVAIFVDREGNMDVFTNDDDEAHTRVKVSHCLMCGRDLREDGA